MGALRWIFALSALLQGASPISVDWRVDSLERIGGHAAIVLGAPSIADSPDGRAVQFDGIDDALQLETNPLAGAGEFTIEVSFRPDAGGGREQRFLHFAESDERRVLFETRVTEDGRWFLDTFIKSDDAQRTLQSRQNLHPLGAWYRAALVYRAGEMRHFIDGVEEMRGAVNFRPHSGGRSSIGCRMNRVSWFRGAIRRIRVTPRALEPADFLR